MKASVLKTASLVVIFALSTAAESTPHVTLSVANTNLRMAKAGGSAVIRADAVATGGFVGTVYASIHVTLGRKSNDGILLRTSNSAVYVFHLSSGQSTQTTKPPQTAWFTVTTDPDNKTTGTITYVVDIVNRDEKRGIEIFNGPQFVTVSVEELPSERTQDGL